MKTSTSKSASVRKGDESESPNLLLKNVLFMLTGLTVVILVMLLILSCNRVIGVLTFLSVAGASVAGGAALGFLFGFPKALKIGSNNKDDKEFEKNSSYRYNDNTNLEEVSDWLTKIIVGLTLIKLNTIIGWIDLSAKSIATVYVCNCGDKCQQFYVFGYGIIILYFLAGAGIFYVWARTNLSIILERSKEKQLEIQNIKLITKLQSLANSTVLSISEVSKESNKEIDATIPNVNFRAVTESIYNAKPIFNKDDLQKGRWGGKSQAGGKLLEAIYNASESVPGLASVKLRVRSIDPDNLLNGEVAFFLHDTFSNEIKYAVAHNNLAEINLMVWEAFVVGARLEDGTELELDLNTVKGFPDDFYWK